MARDRDIDNASASSDNQSKPRDHALQTDSSAPQHRSKQHQKQRHVGRVHSRVPSSKVLHKSHQHSQSSTKLNRRAASPSDRDNQQRPSAPQRRSTSELKLSRNSSSSTLVKNTSQSNLKRNRSSVEVTKRTRSTDKLKRTSSGTGLTQTTSPEKPNKSQVHFDLGLDDADEDEWVDASGSNSPYLSRKGSINSSGPSSLRPGFSSQANSRPETPNNPVGEVQAAASETETAEEEEPDDAPNDEDRERAQHKEYLTSRLLQRTASYGAAPKMSADVAQAISHYSPDSTDRDGSMSSKSGHEGLTSRFVEASTSGLTSEGSFYHHTTEYSRSVDPDAPRRVQSTGAFSDSHRRVVNGDSHHHNHNHHHNQNGDNSVLVPRSAARISGLPAETSRTQQKLNLQRASSVIEPSQAATSVVGAVGTSPWIGVGGPGFDGGTSRDPRVGRLLEKTGMEYLVVRRYQNPISRSLNRLGRLPGVDKSQRIPRPSSGTITNGKRPAETPTRHARNVSMPDPRQTAQSRRVATIRSSGAGSSFDGDDMSRLSERLSETSMSGSEENDTTAMLRNLWDRPVELSASTESAGC